MDITPLVRSDAQIIQSYKGGSFKISGKIYEGPVIVTPVQAIAWDVSDFNNLKAENFVIQKGAEILLLGTGPTQKFLPQELRKSLKNKGLSVETMDTGAACRTYNVLMAESRQVVAFLLPF